MICTETLGTAGPRIAVVGDIFLDQYDYCVNRQNPESSAPCYTVVRSEYKPGGAGNVAANLSALGARVTLATVCGDDWAAEVLCSLMVKWNIDSVMVTDESRPTIVKQRGLSAQDGRYHFRVDFEKKRPIEANHTSELLDPLRADHDCYIVSDYAKGVVSGQLISALNRFGKPVIVDPKPEHLEYYEGTFLVKPNSHEAVRMAGVPDDLEAADLLRSRLNCHILLSRAEKGMVLIPRDGPRAEFRAAPIDNPEVTGAGDSVVAALAYYVAAGLPLADAAALANTAAGISVRHVGCYQPTRREIEERHAALSAAAETSPRP